MQNEHSLQQLWQSANAENQKIEEKEFLPTLAAKFKNEQKVIMQYYWASFIYQLVIYSIAAHVMIRHWGNMEVTSISIALILLYMPFTFIQMRRYKAICTRTPGSLNQDISKYVHEQHALLESFFRFKLWYDRFIVPLNLLLITALIFTAYVPGGIRENLVVAGSIFLIALIIFMIVLEKENRDKFQGPLEKLKLLQNELNLDV
jgi:hypothetical protein